MASRILYHKETKEIIWCQPKPHGSAGLPSFKALCRSARVPEVEKEKMGTVTIDGEYLTTPAKERFYIADGQAKVKPTAELTLSSSEVFVNEPTELTVTSTVSELEVSIGEENHTLATNEPVELVFEYPDEFEIKIIDEAVQPVPGKKVVVTDE